MDGSSVTTYTYDLNGNLVGVREPIALTTMSYDQENRLVQHQNGSTITSYSCDGDGLKRTEQASSAAVTTLVWDGDEYLQGRN